MGPSTPQQLKPVSAGITLNSQALVPTTAGVCVGVY